MADIEIEIDGQKLTAQPNQTVIQVADEAGIYIPRFCYHKHLSIPANCRMCLVEVEKSPKAVPACATPVMAGMKVFTKSQKTVLAQRAVMEFLLINHPLDCPVCDQGGECELQDLSMGYGSGKSDYNECKRSVADENLGPLIATEMTRCIFCTRCIRFGQEIAGLPQLGMTFRGEHEEVTTFVEQALTSEVSGNIIDICPVGALTSKPYRFTARAWELNQAPSISPHDCIGSNLNIHTRYGTVMRVVSRENQAINQTWISDRDRFSYEGLYHADRLQEPMAKIGGVWEIVDWQRAFEIAASGLQTVIHEYGAEQIGALASPNSTVEEFYLLQKIMRALGSANVDHRLRETDMQDQHAMPLFPGLNMSLADLEQCDTALLIGSNLQKEQPIASLRLRKAALKGAQVLVINPVDYAFNFAVAAKQIIAPQNMVNTLAAIVKALDQNAAQEFNVTIDEAAKRVVQQLQAKTNTIILLGALALHHPQASVIRYLAQKISELTGAKLGFMTDGSNSAGGWIAGAVPHRTTGGATTQQVGLNAYEMVQQARKAYLLLNVEPDLDCANAALAREALKEAQCVIALSMYRDPILEAHADVILPIAAFTETAGTFINAVGEWQRFHGVAQAFSSSRPAWKVLRVLGNFLQLNGFDYESVDQIHHEIRTFIDKEPIIAPFVFHSHAAENTQPQLSRIGEVPLYALDSLVRRSQPLQEAQVFVEGDTTLIRMHPDTARKLQIAEGEKVKVKQQANTVLLVVKFDSRIAIDAVWVAGGIAATSTLGDLFGTIEIEKA